MEDKPQPQMHGHHREGRDPTEQDPQPQVLEPRPVPPDPTPCPLGEMPRQAVPPERRQPVQARGHNRASKHGTQAWSPSLKLAGWKCQGNTGNVKREASHMRSISFC